MFASRYLQPASDLAGTNGAEVVPEDEYIKVLRLLVNHRTCDLFEANFKGENVLHVYRGPTKGSSWLLSQVTALEIQTQSQAKPLWTELFTLKWDHTTELIRQYIKSPASRFSIHQPDQDGFYILHYALFRWASVETHEPWELRNKAREPWELRNKAREPWELLLREILQAGVDFHSISPTGITPFQLLFGYSELIPNSSLSFPKRRDLRKCLSRWLQILQDEGIDLRSYREKEHKLWNARKVYSRKGITCMEIHTRGWVDIRWESPKDPFLEDKRLDWSWGLGTKLGGFWGLVGGKMDQELVIPCPDFESSSNSDFDSDSDISDSDEELPRVPGGWDDDCDRDTQVISLCKQKTRNFAPTRVHR